MSECMISCETVQDEIDKLISRCNEMINEEDMTDMDITLAQCSIGTLMILKKRLGLSCDGESRN